MTARILLLITMLCWSLQADIVVVVSDRSELKSLSENEVRQLFLNNFGGESVAVEGVSKRVQEEFYMEIAGKTASQLRAYRARQIFSGRGKPPRRLKADEIETYLNAHPDAVTYLEDAHLPSTFRIVYRLE